MVSYKLFITLSICSTTLACSNGKTTTPIPEKFVLEDNFDSQEYSRTISLDWHESSYDIPLFSQRDAWCNEPAVVIKINHKEPKHTNFCHSGLCGVGGDNGEGGFVYETEYKECVGPDGKPLGERSHPMGNADRTIYLQFPNLSKDWMSIEYNSLISNISPRFSGFEIDDLFVFINLVNRNKFQMEIYSKIDSCYSQISAQESYALNLNLFDKFKNIKHAVKFHSDSDEPSASWWYGIKDFELEGRKVNFSIVSNYESELFDYSSCYPPQNVDGVDELIF